MFEKFKRYILLVLLGIDHLLNAITGGHPKHTISGRVGHYANQGHPVAVPLEKILDSIFFWDNKHCQMARRWDQLKEPH